MNWGKVTGTRIFITHWTIVSSSSTSPDDVIGLLWGCSNTTSSMYRTTLLACGFAALTLAQICDPKLKAKEDRPTDLRCGQRGTLSNSKAEQRYLISYVSDNTLDGCAKYCLGSEGCNFFTLDTKKNYYSQCHIYKRTGRVMGAVGNASSPLHLYVSLTDRHH